MSMKWAANLPQSLSYNAQSSLRWHTLAPSIRHFVRCQHPARNREIKGGEDWYKLIHEAMLEARVAVLLVSEHFLDSDFIQEVEVPRLMQSHAEDGMRIYPMIIWPCLWQFDEWLASKQVRPKDGAPLARGSEHEIKNELVQIASEVFEIVKSNKSESS